MTPSVVNGCTGPEPGSTITPSKVAHPTRVPDREPVGADGGRRRLDLVDPAMPEVTALVDHVVVEQVFDPALHAQGVPARPAAYRFCAANTPSALVSNTGVSS